MNFEYKVLSCLAAIAVTVSPLSAGVVKLDDAIEKSLGAGFYLKQTEEKMVKKMGTGSVSWTLGQIHRFNGEILDEKGYEFNSFGFNGGLLQYKNKEGHYVVRGSSGKEAFRGEAEYIFSFKLTKNQHQLKSKNTNLL